MSDQEQRPPSATPGPDPGADPMGAPGGHGAAPPPPPPPQGAPPGAPPPAADPLPWENRSQVGFGAALLRTAQLFIGRPREAFDRALRRGDYASPLLWVLMLGVLMGIVNWLYGMMFVAPLMAFVPDELRDQLGPFVTMAVMGGGIAKVFFHPIGVVIGTFVWAAIAHVCVLLVAGGGKSGAGFEGTFRAGAYTQVAQIAGILPLVGGLITLVWSVVLLVIGISSMHRIGTGSAVLVVVIPILVGCACAALVAMSVASLIGLAHP